MYSKFVTISTTALPGLFVSKIIQRFLLSKKKKIACKRQLKIIENTKNCNFNQIVILSLSPIVINKLLQFPIDLLNYNPEMAPSEIH
jgi:hypothetical protein